MTNVNAAHPSVKASTPSVSADPAADAGRGAAAGPADSASRPLGHTALEISKLLVEVLQVGHVGRRAGPDAVASAEPDSTFTAHGGGGTPGGGSGPLSSHVIRAAIHIYGNGPQTVGQLAAGLGVSQGWASRVVDEMERAGYVGRERDPGDRRVVRVSLVPAAVERVEKAYRWRGDAVEAALEGLSPEERAAVSMFLRRFVDEVRASAG